MRVSDGWTSGFNYGYLDASFDKYLDNSFAPGRPVIDTADNRLPGYAPENTFGANLDGRLLETQYGNLRLFVDYTYMDSYFLYGVNDDLSLLVKNLTDSDKMTQGIDFSMFRSANWQYPRTWLLTVA